MRLELNPARSVGALLTGLYIFLFVALMEENLYRGFIFQRLLNGVGVWPAQITLASLFAFGHWDNPGMQSSTEVVASLDLFLGAVLLGLAYLRIRSLALPIGLHLGWNWTQGHVLGFAVSGYDHTAGCSPPFRSRPSGSPAAAVLQTSPISDAITSLFICA